MKEPDGELCVSCLGPLLTERGLVCSTCREAHLLQMRTSFRKTVTMKLKGNYL